MGLPVLTQVGRSFSARVAASLLAAVDLAELAVDDAAEYERLAIEFAHDRAALQRCRDHLSERRMQLALFDNRRFSAEIGELFSRMVERWSRGQAPEALPAQPLRSLPAQALQR
jgi:predicted O-linked N-acetylglucosamine transferase (SPINDLY family)